MGSVFRPSSTRIPHTQTLPTGSCSSHNHVPGWRRAAVCEQELHGNMQHFYHTIFPFGDFEFQREVTEFISKPAQLTANVPHLKDRKGRSFFMIHGICSTYTCKTHTSRAMAQVQFFLGHILLWSRPVCIAELSGAPQGLSKHLGWRK